MSERMREKMFLRNKMEMKTQKEALRASVFV